MNRIISNIRINCYLFIFLLLKYVLHANHTTVFIIYDLSYRNCIQTHSQNSWHWLAGASLYGILMNEEIFDIYCIDLSNFILLNFFRYHSNLVCKNALIQIFLWSTQAQIQIQCSVCIRNHTFIHNAQFHCYFHCSVKSIYVSNICNRTLISKYECVGDMPYMP